MPPPVLLWIIIGYLLVFAGAEFRFRTHYDVLMEDIESLEQQLIEADKTSRQSFVQLIKTLPELQNRQCPKDPQFLNPISIIGSLAVKEINQEALEKTMAVFSQWKTQLSNINFDKPIFKDFNLDGLVLSGSRLTLPRFENVSLRNSDFSETEILLGVFERVQLDQANFNGALVAYSSFSDNEEHWLLSKNSSSSDDQKPDLSGGYLLSVNLRNFSVDPSNLMKAASLYKSALSVKSCDEVSKSNKTLFSPPIAEEDNRLKEMEQFAKTYQFESDNPLASFLSNMTGRTCVR